MNKTTLVITKHVKVTCTRYFFKGNQGLKLF